MPPPVPDPSTGAEVRREGFASDLTESSSLDTHAWKHSVMPSRSVGNGGG